MNPTPRGEVRKAVNETRDSLIHTLDSSIETFARIRSSDAMCVAAFDTLKQARAMIARALQQEQRGSINAAAAHEPALVG
jgi:hypothetical protein